ncbi:hypothetical protein [Leptospirillum ferriphilum]|uniref:phage fiber-tail adaptor protein n=1 Tax=Leptospirillum ferriphilum TaxID=178606 RepID=UPI0009855E09|nr:hypothetical protein [Leptospirillum ferriphilum]OOH80812.1 hypothetical protein BOX30_05595 [Leptospirillum ferriphilum]
MLTTLTPQLQSPQYTSESLVRGVDFSPQLAQTGDTLTGVPTVSVSVLSGTDTNPSAILTGTPAVSSNAMQALQRIKGGVAGTTYLVSFVCGTTQGNIMEGQIMFSVVQG